MAINTPKDKSFNIPKELLDSPTGGYFGVMKTLQKVRVPFMRLPAIPRPRCSSDGRDIRLPSHFLLSRPPDAPLAPEEYVEKLQARMEEIHHLAMEKIGMASVKLKTRYDVRATGHDFHEGAKLWLWNPKHPKELSPMLHTNWEGRLYIFDGPRNFELNYSTTTPHQRELRFFAALLCTIKKPQSDTYTTRLPRPPVFLKAARISKAKRRKRVTRDMSTLKNSMLELAAKFDDNYNTGLIKSFMFGLNKN
ncbi:retrovirus-related Pol polyprotein from transposon 412 [Trichonephila clavipes]|nr:retrovirus-related Pol polyprotein from transposon 412 [Trichonephila clavipes]